MTGLRPKDFRERLGTQLRKYDFNQVNIELIMGHSALVTNSTYAGSKWDEHDGIFVGSGEYFWQSST